MESAHCQFQINGLSFSYPGSKSPALYKLHLQVERGQFLALCGPSGSGKTTLLRLLKPSLAPHGQREGELFFAGTPLEELDARSQSSRIGFVMQSPDNQLVTDKVWHELAFGLESLGADQQTIRRRVAEMADFFGIEGWFHRDVTTLSGGQKQLLNLAAIMTMQPEVLLLDEPTGQLDPIAAGEFLAALGRINRELGTTIIISEHRLEEVFPYSDRVVVLDEGQIIANAPPAETGLLLRQSKHAMFAAMPVPMRVWSAVDNQLACPVTVREGRQWLNQLVAERQQQEFFPLPPTPASPTADSQTAAITPAISMSGVWFRYQQQDEDVLRGVDLQLFPGELLAVMGGNGAGKSTLLSLLTGLYQPQRGTIKIEGRDAAEISNQEKFTGLLGALPQNPQALFVKKTVGEDLAALLKEQGLSDKQQQIRLERVIALCRLQGLLDRHPYDISGGEQQRAALAKVLLLEPRILLLDEPTKGLDADFKQVLAAILRQLLQDGVSILMVSHDIEFCAKHAHRCAMVFDGRIVSEGPAREFFAGNSFYTTSANRMARHLLPEAVTAEDIIIALEGSDPTAPDNDRLAKAEMPLATDNNPDKNQEENKAEPTASQPAEAANEQGTANNSSLSAGIASSTSSTDNDNIANATADMIPARQSVITEEPPLERSSAKRTYPVYKTVLAIVLWLFAGALIALLIHEWQDLPEFAVWQAQANFSRQLWLYAGEVLLAIVAIITGLWLLPRRRQQTDTTLPGGQKLSPRTKAAAILVILLIPLTIFIGEYYLGARKYFFISLLIILEAMLPFALIFEGLRPQARELVTIAVLCAIAVAGRAAFFMLPQFKPMLALVIIAAVAFGGEAGFIVGAVSVFVSNFFLSQGPWTPWQMFAMGLIGFIAGVLFRKGLISRKPLPLAIFGALATFFIYGGIMNPASVLMFQSEPTLGMFITSYALGMPMDLVHAASTFFFLLVISRPFLEKLDRLKNKYGMMNSRNQPMTTPPSS